MTEKWEAEAGFRNVDCSVNTATWSAETRGGCVRPTPGGAGDTRSVGRSTAAPPGARGGLCLMAGWRGPSQPSMLKLYSNVTRGWSLKVSQTGNKNLNSKSQTFAAPSTVWSIFSGTWWLISILTLYRKEKWGNCICGFNPCRNFPAPYFSCFSQFYVMGQTCNVTITNRVLYNIHREKEIGVAAKHI